MVFCLRLCLKYLYFPFGELSIQMLPKTAPKRVPHIFNELLANILNIYMQWDLY